LLDNAQTSVLWILIKVKKGKNHTLAIAPISEGTALQKRSGMARVVVVNVVVVVNIVLNL